MSMNTPSRLKGLGEGEGEGEGEGGGEGEGEGEGEVGGGEVRVRLTSRPESMAPSATAEPTRSRCNR